MLNSDIEALIWPPLRTKADRFATVAPVKARSDYLPFGEERRASGTLPSQRFTGQQQDAEEDLDCFNAPRGLQKIQSARPHPGDRMLLRGTAYGMTVEMWFNRATRVIETAYPVP
jgi:hypothetical protein